MSQPPVVPGSPQPGGPPPGYQPPPPAYQQPPGPPPPGFIPASVQQPRQRKGMSSGTVVGIVLGSIAGVVVLCFGLSMLWAVFTPGSGGSSSQGITVTLDDCTSRGGGFYAAHLTVTNHSDRVRSTVITVEFVDANDGTRLARDVEFVNDLAPGQSSREEALGYGAEASSVRCDMRQD